MISTYKSEIEPTAVKAAAGFHTESQGELESSSDFEFLFTRAIEFRQETIYFIIVDRFYDGDPNNNPGSNPQLYDPTRQQWGKYWGGDLQGIIDKLDYLKGMGVTALWISPLFEQVEELQFERAAMHGYWTKDFKRINPRFLAKDEDNSLSKCTALNRLIKAMHARGMKLILDIVCNHSSPDVNGHKGELYDDGVLIADFYNDVNNWYHHNPEITDWEDEWQLLYGEMAGLATFNESNIDFRNYIKSAVKQWLDRGVDALRIDTVKHMPIWFWQEFITDIQTTHKPSIFIFGEWGFSKPWEQKSVDFANYSGMSILDFGLCEAIRGALAKGDARGFYLIQDVFALDRLYYRATELITFIDNHDMPRFQSLNSDPDNLRMAIALLMTSRGIPCIYYGTEQYLHNDTNGGEEPYNRPMMANWDSNSPLYRDIQLFSKLRRLNPAVSLGSQVQKYLTADIYCYTRSYRDSRCFVAMNRGNWATIDVDTNLEDGEYRCLLTQRTFYVRDGKLSRLELGTKEIIILSYIGDRILGQTIVRVQLNGITTQPGETVVITGDCPELGNWDISKAYALEYINPNTWVGEIPFTESSGKAIAYKYALWREKDLPLYENTISRRWILAEGGIVKWQDIWEK